MNIGEKLKQARQLQQVEHAEQEVKKLGTLRGGNSGIISETGDVAGQCHRQSHLRSLGIKYEAIEDPKLIMFQLGFANEDVLVADLMRTLPEGYTILREEEIPISWTTRNGTTVSGRPDVVICRKDPLAEIDSLKTLIPTLGLELKSVHSVWTARSLIGPKAKPKMNNVIQAAHYMWKLGVPYKLIYKSYSALGQGMSWAKQMASMFPKQGEPGSEFMSYNEKGVPKEVSQFEVIWDLRIANGRVEYKPEHSADSWIPTLVTTADIERYYETVSQMSTTKELGNRPQALHVDGSEENYSSCDYCPLSDTCDKYESNYNEWLQRVKKFTQVLNK